MMPLHLQLKASKDKRVKACSSEIRALKKAVNNGTITAIEANKKFNAIQAKYKDLLA